MKKNLYRRIVIVLVLLVVLASAVLLIVRGGGFSLRLPSLSLVREETRVSSDTLLLHAADLLSVETIEIVRKSVFPYDFVPDRYPWAVLQSKAKNGMSLTPEEASYLSAFDTARAVGINLAVPDYRFIVATLRIRAGFNLSAWRMDPGSAVEIDHETGRATVRLPAVSILDIVIEDPSPEAYEYPDIRINPEQWRVLSAFLMRRTEEAGIAPEILAEAETRGKEFLRAFFEAAGFSEIVFVSAD